MPFRAWRGRRSDVEEADQAAKGATLGASGQDGDGGKERRLTDDVDSDRFADTRAEGEQRAADQNQDREREQRQPGRQPEPTTVRFSHRSSPRLATYDAAQSAELVLTLPWGLTQRSSTR